MDGILSCVFSIVVGIVCLVIAILNMCGNISMLHSYHIKNIKEEDKLPFGKRVGLGMIIVGISLITYGALMMVFELTSENIYSVVSNVVLIIGLVIGLGISLYAIKKYNKSVI